MASQPPTTVQEGQESNPAKKYVSYASFMEDNWRYRRPNFPFFVSGLSAYGIVVQSERFIENQIYYDNSGEVIQENFPEQISAAIRRMLAYYNKIVDETNMQILEPVTVLQDIYVQPGPNIYYITIDAATFDSIPDQGNYILTPMTERTSIGKLAEDYREYFRVTDRTAKGHRARLAEILRINNVDILTPDINNVKEWMGRLNYGTTNPQKKDVRLNPGSEIYLPRVEPDFDKVINGGREFSLKIGSIQSQVGSMITMLQKFKDDISQSGKVVKVLDISKQIDLLQKFFPKIVTHFQTNGYKITDFLDDEIRLGISSEYELVYVALSAQGSLAYLNKGLPGIIVDVPFDDPRTINFLLNLKEISLYNQATYQWQDFVEDYVFPSVTITTRTSDDLLADFTDTKKTIMEQLADRFDKFPVKSDRILGEENELLESPRLIAAAAEQNANVVRSTGDAVVSNLVDISAKLENPGTTACGAAKTVFSEVLNKIDYKQLASSALSCLREQIPFECNDIIMSVATLPSVQMGAFGLSGETISGLEAVNTVFKSRMTPEQREVATEAFSVARTLDFLVGEEKYGFPLYQTLEEDYGDSDPNNGELYLAALELGFTNSGYDYNSVFQEVCTILSNPIDLIPKEVMNFPTLFFPKIPTVDLDATFFSSVEAAMLDMISALIVEMTKSLIDSILNNCVEQQQLADESADSNNPNLADLTSAIANNVGDENLAKTLEDLLESLGYGDFPEDDDEISEEDPELEITDTTVEVTTAVQAMKDFFNALSEQMSDSMKVISLLEGFAPGNLIDEVLTIIQSGDFRYGLNNERNLNEIIVNEADVRWMFEKIAKLVDIQPIISSLNAAVGKVGCDNINDFISKRIALWCENVPKEEITTLAANIISGGVGTGDDLTCLILSPFDTPPLTCEDNLPPNCFLDSESSFGGSVAKDPASFSHALGEVLDRFFEPVYMAYDASALTLPDPYYSDVERKKEIARTIKTSAGISVDYFNFAKLQEEKTEIIPSQIFGEASVVGKTLDKLGIKPPGEIEAVTMNPEFQRLLSTGYIPDNGVVDGLYGPYTTAVPKSKVEGSFSAKLGITPQNLGLPPVSYIDKKPEFAPRSRNVFENLDERIKTFDATFPGTTRNAFVFEASEPTDPTDKTRLSLNALKFEMFDDNSWRLNVGETLPNVSEFAPFSPAAVAAGSAPTTFEIAGSSYSSEAVYNLEYTGESKFPEEASDLLEYIESRTPSLASGEIPQIKILSRFIANLMSNANREGELTQGQLEEIEKFAKENVFPDCFKQMTFGVAKHCLSSPMFRFSEANGAPLMSIVDWAPLPTEDDAACGYDPHILSIDTMKRRIIEDYEEKIECENIGDEINQSGLGKDSKTSLEKAMMSGVVMTTLRAYSLEQLMRAIFPVSSFPCKSFLSPVIIKYIVSKVIEELKETDGDYFEAFLEEVVNVFADRMGTYSPYGTIPDVIASGSALGIEWQCADAAIQEFLSQSPMEDGAVTLPSGEKVEISSITAGAISEQFESFPQPEGPVGGSGLSDVFTGPATGDEDTGTTGTGLPTTEVPTGGRGTGITSTISSLTEPSDEPSFTDTVGQSFTGPSSGNQTGGIAEPPATVNEGVPTIAEEIEDIFVGPVGTEPLVKFECPDNINSVKIDKSPLEDIVRARLCFLIEEQLYSVLDKLQDLVSFNGEFSFDDRFISKNMPLLDVAKDQIEIDGSRFFAGDSDKVVSLTQARVDAVYDVYLEKYNEWHTANGNWAAALTAAPLSIVALGLAGAGAGALLGTYVFPSYGTAVGAIVGAIVGAVMGLIGTALAGPVLLKIIKGEQDIPVPRYIWPEELENNPDANIFYESKDGIKYVYTDTDIKKLMESFLTSVSEMLKVGIESLFDELFSPLLDADGNFDITSIISDLIEEEGPVATLKEGLNKTVDDVLGSALVAASVLNPMGGPIGAATLSNLLKVTWSEPYFESPGIIDNRERNDKGDPIEPKLKNFLGGFPFIGDIVSALPGADQYPLTALTITLDENSVIPSILKAGAAGIEGNSLVPYPKLEDFAGDLEIPEEGLVARDEVEGTLVITESERLASGEVDVGRGQVITERYVKTRGKLPGDISTLFGQQPSDSFVGERYSKEQVQDPRMGAVNGEITSISQVLSPRETIDTSTRNCVNLENGNLPPGLTLNSNTSLGGEIYTPREKIWNIEEFQEYLENNNLEMSDQVFDDISFGMRLVYVSSPPEVVPMEPILGGANAPLLELQKKTILPGSTQEFVFDEDVAEREKAFFEKETYVLNFKGDVFSPVPESGKGPIPQPILKTPSSEIRDNQGNVISTNTKERYLHTFPLFSAEKRIDSISGIPRKDILEVMNIGDGQGQKSMKRVFNDDYLSFLSNSLRDSEVYKLLFKFCIPGDNILSFVSIMANLTNELSDGFFDGTKYQLQNLFEITANAGDYTFKTSDDRKKGGNRGEYARALANYGTEGAARNPALFDLAIKTPKLIFKGLAEFIDPVINPASKIVKAGAAGKLIPQVMKKLNPDNSPGGVDEDNYFLTNLIFPKGTVLPPVGDFAGRYPTVIRKTPQGLPIPFAENDDNAPDIKRDGEIVVFRFRDKLTKASETGNILFDRYMQKVFVNYNPSKSDANLLYINYKSSSELRTANMTDKQLYFQEFALANMNRNFPALAAPLIQAYREDLEVVRNGILVEIPEAADYLFDFSPFTFQRIKQLSRDNEQIRCMREGIINILKGARAVNPDNFLSEGRSLATGFLAVFNPESGELETVSGEGRTIDWIIWGEPAGNFLMPEIPSPEVIFPGYPIPLPVTSIAYSFLPSDVFPYSPFPPHSPLGHIYHAISATDNLQSSNLDLKAVQRKEEGIDNKKKIREKLCIDMERLSNEEKKRRGLE